MWPYTRVATLSLEVGEGQLKLLLKIRLICETATQKTITNIKYS